MDLNREFAELAGICWHEPIDRYSGDPRCSCGFKPHLTAPELDIHVEKNNPDYAADPRLVLREMRKRAGWQDFAENVFKWRMYDVVDYVLDTTGKLRDKAIEWLENKST